MGDEDGQAKDVSWAAEQSALPAEVIRELALDLGRARSVLGISWSLQRQEYGEQTYWMITTLGAMLGHIGLPGSGVAYGYGCIHNMGFGGRRIPNYKLGTFRRRNRRTARHGEEKIHSCSAPRRYAE